MDQKSSQWKQFEINIADLQGILSPNAIVTHNERIKGSSGILRQVDVSIRQNIGQFQMLIAIECKDLKEKVDIKDVESFDGLLRDIRAHKGAMVSSSGFTQGALSRANDLGIDLFDLASFDSEEIKSYAKTIPVFAENDKGELYYKRIKYKLTRMLDIKARRTISTSFELEPIDADEVEKSWKRIQNINEIAISSPLPKIKVHYSSQ